MWQISYFYHTWLDLRDLTSKGQSVALLSQPETIKAMNSAFSSDALKGELCTSSGGPTEIVITMIIVNVT